MPVKTKDKEMRMVMNFLTILKRKDTRYILEFLNEHPNSNFNDVFLNNPKRTSGYVRLRELESINFIKVTEHDFPIQQTYNLNYQFIAKLITLLSSNSENPKLIEEVDFIELKSNDGEISKLDFSWIKHLLSGMRLLHKDNTRELYNKIVVKGEAEDHILLFKSKWRQDFISKNATAMHKAGLITRKVESRYRVNSAELEYVAWLYNLVEQITDLKFSIFKPKPKSKLPGKPIRIIKT